MLVSPKAEQTLKLIILYSTGNAEKLAENLCYQSDFSDHFWDSPGAFCIFSKKGLFVSV